MIKCYEYSLIGQELPYNVQEINAERQAIRDKINELEKQIEEMEKDIPEVIGVSESETAEALAENEVIEEKQENLNESEWIE